MDRFVTTDQPGLLLLHGFGNVFQRMLRPGESIDHVRVSEGGQAYSPGASAELGSSGTPGTYGTTETDKGERIVWHYSAADEARAFTIQYRLSGLTVAYRDVADVNLKVWGDEWKVGLGRLHAVLVLPGRASGPSYRVFGAPVWVRGDVTRRPQDASLRALGIPDRQFVELRVVFPRRLLRSTAAAKVRSGLGLPKILADLREFAAEDPLFWKPSPLIVDLVARGANFDSLNQS